MKTILYSIPLGVFARNLLRSGVIDYLLHNEEIRIVLLTPAYKSREFIKEFSRDGRVFFERLFPVDSHLGLPEKVLWKLCNVFGLRFEVKPLFLQLMHMIDRYYIATSKKMYTEVFRKYQPDLVITASPGNTSPLDVPVVREAKSLNIPTICLIHSWDNIVGLKGIMPTRPDWLGVWSQLQKEEAEKINYYEPSRVKVVGPPHFDIYQKKETFQTKETFFNKMGLDSNKRLITVVVATTTSSENTYVIDIIIEAIKNHRFSVPVQLLVRLHPRVHPDKNKKDYANYVDNPLVTIDYPYSYDKDLKWNPNREEMIHLANTLKHSDVVVNIASTVTIEAAILDIPVVILGFSSSEPEEFRRKIIEGHWKLHYRYILERDCVYVANNPEDLILGINNYLLDPSIHRQGRQKMAKDLCYRLDGKAAERISQLIIDLLNDRM